MAGGSAFPWPTRALTGHEIASFMKRSEMKPEINSFMRRLVKHDVKTVAKPNVDEVIREQNCHAGIRRLNSGRRGDDHELPVEPRPFPIVRVLPFLFDKLDTWNLSC